MKKFAFIFFLFIATASTLVLTSCSNDDEPARDFTFNAGFIDYSGTGTEQEILAEIKQIEQIYYSALGITSSDFTMKGTEKECKDKITSACKKAEQEIERNTWHCSFTYTVFLINKATTVYSYTYPKK